MSAEGRAASGRMEGQGFYTEHSEAQRGYVELGLEWLGRAAGEVEPPPDGPPFVVADMGAAGGGNSLAPMRRALAARRGDGPALVVHTDIPSNDFSALFELVGTSPDSYADAPEVFTLAAGRSFYERLLPERFLSVGWSSIAVHWLSAVPAPIPDHIYCSFATGAVRDALRAQSGADWLAFLRGRARELRPSGRLVVLGGAAQDDGRSGAEGLMDMANGALGQLVEAGALTPAEHERMTIPTWNRTEAEFVAPFEAGELDGELTLLRHELRWLPDGYFEAYAADGDLDAYTGAVAGFFRAAFEQSLWAALDSGRSEADRAALAASFHERLRAAIVADPERAACRWLWCCSTSCGRAAETPDGAGGREPFAPARRRSAQRRRGDVSVGRSTRATRRPSARTTTRTRSRARRPASLRATALGSATLIAARPPALTRRGASTRTR